MSNEQILIRKLDELFSDKKGENEAINILDKYGKEDYEQETVRVRLAILKLSGSSLDKIIEFTDSAKQDYRDILSWAEYPRQSKNWSVPEGKKKQKLIDDDKAEYQEWLNTKQAN
jgi:hypothetical protein